jgi:hypothetical protein
MHEIHDTPYDITTVASLRGIHARGIHAFSHGEASTSLEQKLTRPQLKKKKN